MRVDTRIFINIFKFKDMYMTSDKTSIVISYYFIAIHMGTYS